ncbi:MAG: glutamyl-tRNA reductase, partial [Actinomycetota bacterium]|nr:glutamyl-tRNA reductase [Actinomycetota bacterium]
ALVSDVLAARPGRSLTVVDLSLPRNVDPAVQEVPGVRLLDLDDLADVACGSVPDPRAVAGVEAAVRDAADAYCAEIRSRRAGPLITALRSRVESTCLEQLRRTTQGLGLAEEELTRMASAVAGALAHSPSVLARESAADDDHATLAVLAAVFRLHA